MNVVTLLDMAVDGGDERVTVGPRLGGLTARELRRRAACAAPAFRGSQHRHVVYIDENALALPVAFLGAAVAGLPFAPLNYRLADDQLNAILEQLTPAVVVASPDEARRVAVSGIEILRPDEIAGTVSATDYVEDAESLDGDADDVAVMLFTSGTTGAPKAAVLRHRHLFAYVVSTVEFMSASPDEALLVSVPPYHIAGVSTILSSLYSGRRIVYLAAFDAGMWVRTATDERISHAMVVPTMLSRILDVLESEQCKLPALRHLSYGGGPMPLEVIARAMTLLPDVDFVNAYGLTETSSTICVLGPDDHRVAHASDDPAIRRRLRSVGRPLPTVEVEVRSPEGSVLGAEQPGEIYVRGEQVAGEYLGRNLLTEDGWFPTNDAGLFDADGYLYLEGRLDDVIVRGAENLSPGEIEDVLVAHDGVSAACVVGVPDDEWGEAVAAAVVLHPGAAVTKEELREWARSRLRSTRAPELIEFRDELPHNEIGKLLRRVVRQELTASEEGPTRL
jgi:acyl-CoA synthetase (AMP-forming)/AMP-acid ligase II